MLMFVNKFLFSLVFINVFGGCCNSCRKGGGVDLMEIENNVPTEHVKFNYNKKEGLIIDGYHEIPGNDQGLKQIANIVTNITKTKKLSDNTGEDVLKGFIGILFEEETKKEETKKEEINIQEMKKVEDLKTSIKRGFNTMCGKGLEGSLKNFLKNYVDKGDFNYLFNGIYSFLAATLDIPINKKTQSCISEILKYLLSLKLPSEIDFELQEGNTVEAYCLILPVSIYSYLLKILESKYLKEKKYYSVIVDVIAAISKKCDPANERVFIAYIKDLESYFLFDKDCCFPLHDIIAAFCNAIRFIINNNFVGSINLEGSEHKVINFNGEKIEKLIEKCGKYLEVVFNKGMFVEDATTKMEDGKKVYKLDSELVGKKMKEFHESEEVEYADNDKCIEDRFSITVKGKIISEIRDDDLVFLAKICGISKEALVNKIKGMDVLSFQKYVLNQILGLWKNFVNVGKRIYPDVDLLKKIEFKIDPSLTLSDS